MPLRRKSPGIFVSTNQAYDDSALHLPISLAQSLLRVDGAHAWLVLLNDTDHIRRLSRPVSYPVSRLLK